MKKGIFITFEGSDGSGKSTHIRLLSVKLREMGHIVLITREPGGCPISEKIRELVLDKNNVEMAPVTEALLYAASRAQHVAEVIKPALERGEIVISDRYLDSSIAYQGYGRELGEDLVRAVNSPAIAGVLPDITFFMSVGAEVAQGRIADRDLDRLEMAGKSFQERVYTAFQLLAEKSNGRIVTIDATAPKTEVHNRILSIVAQSGILNDRGAVPLKRE